MNCNICKMENTEFYSFSVERDLNIIQKIISKMTFIDTSVDVNICQTCVSKIFKNFKKGK